MITDVSNGACVRPGPSLCFECVSCALEAQLQLSLTAVSWETSDETLHHLFCLCVCVCECMYTQLDGHYIKFQHCRFSARLKLCVCLVRVRDRMFTMDMCVYFLCKSLATKVKLSKVRNYLCVCVCVCYIGLKTLLSFSLPVSLGSLSHVALHFY